VPVEGLLSRPAHLPTARHERARLERLVSQPSAPGLKPSAVLEQFTRVLLEFARGRPMLVVIEDLQWADAGTVSLLFHLCRRLQGSRLAIVGSYRPALLAGGDERHPMETAMHERFGLTTRARRCVR
jgi:predicted ATPase